MSQVRPGGHLAKVRQIMIRGAKAGHSPQQISTSLLEEIGVQKGPMQVIKSMYLLRKAGLVSPVSSAAPRIRQLLAEDPDLSDKAVVARLKAKGIETNTQNVWMARKNAGLKYEGKALRMAKSNPYPKLSKFQLRVLEASMKPLKGVAFNAAMDKGINNPERLEDFYSFCLVDLPRWIPKICEGLNEKAMGRQLVARLRPRVEFRLRHFFVEEAVYRTGMSRDEVSCGFRLKRMLAKGTSIEEAAEKEKIAVNDAKEILAALAGKTFRFSESIKEKDGLDR